MWGLISCVGRCVMFVCLGKCVFGFVESLLKMLLGIYIEGEGLFLNC